MNKHACRDEGSVVGQRREVKELRAMKTYKKQKNRYQVCLFLLINNLDIKLNNSNCRNHSEFSARTRIPAINFVQVDIDKL